MSDNIVYFMFSSSQLSMREETDLNMGRIYVPKKVLVNGRYKEFTEIVSDPSRASFSDAIMVASGIKSQMIIK